MVSIAAAGELPVCLSTLVGIFESYGAGDNLARLPQLHILDLTDFELLEPQLVELSEVFPQVQRWMVRNYVSYRHLVETPLLAIENTAVSTFLSLIFVLS